MGFESPISGRVRLGQYNVHANYFEQNQAEALDLNLTALGTLVEAVRSLFFLHGRVDGV